MGYRKLLATFTLPKVVHAWARALSYLGMGTSCPGHYSIDLCTCIAYQHTEFLLESTAQIQFDSSTAPHHR